MSVKPGLSGLGSIVFRSEENILHSNSANDFYNNYYALQNSNRKFLYKEDRFNKLFKNNNINCIGNHNGQRLVSKSVFPDMPDAPEELKKFL